MSSSHVEVRSMQGGALVDAAGVGRCAHRKRPIGLIMDHTVYCYDGSIWAGDVSGRVIDSLASHYEEVYLCAPVASRVPQPPVDLRIRATNIKLITQPCYAGSLGALPHVIGIARAYGRICGRADALFVRGMCPYIGVLYVLAACYRRRLCHWIVGNTLALLSTHSRRGRLMDLLAMLYACQDRVCTLLGQRLANGVFLCNGQELGRVYQSTQTIVTVSSSITCDEFSIRDDTCREDPIRLLFVGHVRPEKGLEYLIQALPRLRTTRPWKLLVVGSCDQFPEYRAKLDRLVDAGNIVDRVEWAGYASYGPALFEHLRAADILVLPTLSEGTPRVLVEARANSLPVVSTNVGGIPTSVTNGVDGLLVPPKDPPALAHAIDRVVSDGDLRRQLIHNGLRSARRFTVDEFGLRVRGILDSFLELPANSEKAC